MTVGRVTSVYKESDVPRIAVDVDTPTGSYTKIDFVTPIGGMWYHPYVGDVVEVRKVGVRGYVAHTPQPPSDDTLPSGLGPGDLTFDMGVTIGGDLTAADGETIWDESAGHIPEERVEQGSGSGLDADLLDGNHASAFTTDSELSSHSGSPDAHHQRIDVQDSGSSVYDGPSVMNFVGGLSVTNPTGSEVDVSVSGVPSGLIAIWSGSISGIPSGWVLCDGNNGTPNLQDRFVVGAGSSYAVDSTGGESTHTLSVSELASHRHDMSGAKWSNDGLNFGGSQTSDTGTMYTNYTGGDSAHENRPPYYALAYIMKV